MSASALPGPARLPGLDHLRALAISLVLLFHYRIFQHPGWVEEVGSFGWTGVDLFFVLSGYLISAQLLAELARSGTVSLRAYFIKRTFRILPAYLLVVAVYFLVPGFREREALPPLWKFLTFTQNFGLDLGRTGTFSHAWSLCVEEQFYLGLPLALLGLRRAAAGNWAGLLLLVLVAGGFGARLLSWYWGVGPSLAPSMCGGSGTCTCIIPPTTASTGCCWASASRLSSIFGRWWRPAWPAMATGCCSWGWPC